MSTTSHNEVQLSKPILLDLLNDLQSRTLLEFRTQIRLFVHGGAVMVLHPFLSTSSTRRTTRDIDYIRRAFGHEWRKRGVYDAEERLQACINATARRFQVGTDWMNADPDVALPFARDPRGHIYDPIYHDSKQQNNIDMNTIYEARGLRLISVTMFWGVALKLVRYKKEDPKDIVAMLKHGTKLNGVQWTPALMEEWIKTLCWPMGYSQYHPQQLEELKIRIRDAIRLVKMSSDDHEGYASVFGRYARLQPSASMHSLRDGAVSPAPMSFVHSEGPTYPIQPPVPKQHTTSFSHGRSHNHTPLHPCSSAHTPPHLETNPHTGSHAISVPTHSHHDQLQPIFHIPESIAAHQLPLLRQHTATRAF
ncbi:hypothetical protein EDD16DRAFT_247196 [Pisolithus croceorrhizus]|nr:hypothetical protein EDD16DRAFT_247196 [Pisolithus croceorrhizus]KAI6131691.1 hypothetical protein EV401DRAFT_369139 [Pisolithus croceorrhizus]